MAELDRDALVRYVAGISDLIGDVDALRQAQSAEYAAKRAEIDLLIEDRRVLELEGGVLQYQLTHPIVLMHDKQGNPVDTISTVTFHRQPTVSIVRDGAKYVGDEWAAFLIRTLSREIPDDETLNKIHASEWDDLVRVARFPFVHPPSRPGGAESRTSSGGKP